MLRKLFIAVVCLLFILAATNPSRDQYVLWAKSKLSEEVKQREELQKNEMVNTLLTTIAVPAIDKATTQENMGLFTIFTTKFGNQQYKTLGLTNRFILLNSDPAKSAKNE